MTDPSLQKMQTTPIPQEWVEKARVAAVGRFWDAPDDAPAQQTIIEAALAAVIPLVREDERERIKASGCVIVPREATEGMVKAGTERALNTSISSQTGGWPAYISGQWSAMIAASEERE